MKVKSPHFLAVAALLAGLVAHALLCLAPVQTQLTPLTNINRGSKHP